jgi:hypothetical protein
MLFLEIYYKEVKATGDHGGYREIMSNPRSNELPADRHTASEEGRIGGSPCGEGSIRVPGRVAGEFGSNRETISRESGGRQ